MLTALLLAATATPSAPDADPATIPPPIRAMLDAAIAAGDEAAVNAIVKYARTADPASGDATMQVATSWREARARARNERVQQAGMFDLWTGRVEAGGFVSTGNSPVTGLSGAIDLTREAMAWRHKLRALADYQRSGGATTREHYLAAYEPNWKYADRGYLYGSAQYESDRFFGYRDRYSASLGTGYSAVRTPAMTLDIELGPAWRSTDFTDGSSESSIAARGSVDFDLKLASGVTLSHDASAYIQPHNNSTVTGTTALAAKLIGPLSARLSYTVQYESMPPAGRVPTDTTSRASVVYSF